MLPQEIQWFNAWGAAKRQIAARGESAVVLVRPVGSDGAWAFSEDAAFLHELTGVKIQPGFSMTAVFVVDVFETIIEVVKARRRVCLCEQIGKG